MAGEDSPFEHPEIDAQLRRLSQDMAGEEVDEVERDIKDIHYQTMILDALVMEGVNTGPLSKWLDDHPDPTLQKTLHDFDMILNVLAESVVDIPTSSESFFITYFAQQRKLAKMIQQLAWARINVDYGTEAEEAKVVTQLDIYIDPTLSTDEKSTWLRVVDRIIPEHPGLDPSDPSTAVEIEKWVEENNTLL